MLNQDLKHSPLGKISQYTGQYQSQCLFPVARSPQRQEIGIVNTLPFQGVDLWNAYELSWLNAKGKPIAAIGQFIFPCQSSHVVESKAFKLYLNSFNQTSFAGNDQETFDVVKKIMIEDLTPIAGLKPEIYLFPLNTTNTQLNHLHGECIDQLDISCDEYAINPHYLQIENNHVDESLYSHLMKSNCPITGQPDWGTIHIEYTGKKINREGLLRYIVSFRNHQEFHEHCAERIFMDIMQFCQPQKLTVSAFYTRRGGLDINPIRSTENLDFVKRFQRLSRQ